MKVKYFFFGLSILSLGILSCSMPHGPAIEEKLSETVEDQQLLIVETDSDRNQGVYINEKGIKIDISSFEDAEGRVVNCIAATDIVIVKESNSTTGYGKAWGTTVKALVIGKRDDGKPGVWEIHSDDSIHPILMNLGGRSSSLLFESEEHMGRVRGLFGWVYHVVDISDDGRMVVGYAENKDGFVRRDWEIEPGTTIGVYWRLGSIYNGRIKGISRARVIGEPIDPGNLPDSRHPRFKRFIYRFINHFKLFFLDWLEAYLIMPTKVSYIEAEDVHEVEGLDQDKDEAVAKINRSNRITIEKVAPPGGGDVDLHPAAMTLTSGAVDYVADGTTVSVTLPIENLGAGSITPSSSFKVQFYLALDESLGQDQTLEFEDVTGTIDGYDTYNLVKVLTMPDNLNVNQCVYIWADVDVDNDISGESYETNNQSTVATALCVLVYNNEDGGRKYEMVFETFPPTGSNPMQTPGMVVELYDNGGALIDSSFASGYTKVDCTGGAALATGIYYVKIYSFAAGAYGFSVRSSVTMPIPYFGSALGSAGDDPYETGDADNGSNVPDSPVPIRVGASLNRYIDWDTGDIDWFKIVLP